MIKQAGIDFRSLPDEKMDAPLGISTGAADIFAVSGGVCEAALRTVWEIVTETPFPFPNLHVEPIQGLEGVKVATVKVDGAKGDWAFLEGADAQGRRGPRARQRAEGHRPGQERRGRVPLRRGHDLPRRLHRRRRAAALHHQRGAHEAPRGDLPGGRAPRAAQVATRTPSSASCTRSTSGRRAARSRTTSCTPTTSSTTASETRRAASRPGGRWARRGGGPGRPGPPPGSRTGDETLY